tara:strand:+ start:118 stop:366 length:249 start_codon:yes stop_codon:yes gene_type:complete
LKFSVEIEKGLCVRPCAKQAGKRSGFGCGKEKTFVEFKEKFRSLDFFVSFFHQGKNEIHGYRAEALINNPSRKKKSIIYEYA